MAKPKQQNQSNLLAYVLLVVVIIGLSWWSYSKLEMRYEEVDRGYQGEALTNPYLAAEYFLKRMGQKAEKIELFAGRKKDQLKPEDVLLVPGNRLAFDQRRSDKLLDWVERGGHLIITGKSKREEDQVNKDYILDRLGLEIDWQINDDEDFEQEQPSNSENDDDFWQVDFVNYQAVVFTDEFKQAVNWRIELDGKVHALQVQLGQGRLTVMSDMRMFRNDYIDKYDHAAFLFSLSNEQHSAALNGVFYYSLYENHISLYEWLWLNARPLMLSCIVLGLIVLWRMVPRFGPLINVHQPIRRRFLDHLAASGNYHWRQGHYSRLLTDVRKQLSAQIKLKYPEWTDQSKQDQVNHFAELSGLDSEIIEDALFGMNIERVDDFVKKIKVLEKLRTSL